MVRKEQVAEQCKSPGKDSDEERGGKVGVPNSSDILSRCQVKDGKEEGDAGCSCQAGFIASRTAAYLSVRGLCMEQRRTDKAHRG